MPKLEFFSILDEGFLNYLCVCFKTRNRVIQLSSKSLFFFENKSTFSTLTKITFLLIIEVGCIHYIYDYVCLVTERKTRTSVLNKIKINYLGKRKAS